MQSTRGAAVCAAIALMAGGVAACGEDEPVEPTTTASPISVDTDSSTSSSSPSSSSTSTPTSSGDGADLPSGLPEAARKETKEGAAAFGKYYFLAYGDAAHTGDTQTIEKLDLSSCKVCNTGVADIRADAKKGWKRSTNPYTVSAVEATQRPDSGYKVSMSVQVAKHQRLDSTGKPNASVDATSYTLTEHVVWVEGRWQMSDWIVT